MHEIRRSQTPAACQRIAKPESLDHRSGHRETEEGEPADRGEHENPNEQGNWEEHEHGARVRGSRRTSAVHELAGAHIRGRDQGREGEEDERLRVCTQS